MSVRAIVVSGTPFQSIENQFQSMENWVLELFIAEWIFLPLHLHSTIVHVWTHLMICVVHNFPPTSLRICRNVPYTYVNVPQSIESKTLQRWTTNAATKL